MILDNIVHLQCLSQTTSQCCFIECEFTDYAFGIIRQFAVQYKPEEFSGT